MNRHTSRRDWLKTLLALPAGAWMARFDALAAPLRNKVKITAVKAMAVKGISGNALVKIETDQGLTGYGEAGATGPTVRARVQQLIAEGRLKGQDPLAIGRHFHEMTARTYTYRPHVPTISGIDMALWDLAGKITGLPVTVLMGGPFRDKVEMYSHAGGFDPLDPAACKDWVQRAKASTSGFKAFKMLFFRLAGIPGFTPAPPLSTEQIRRVGRGFRNVKEAAGDDLDIGLHCHGEMDTPSGIQVAKAIEPYNPLFLEDPMQTMFCDGWRGLRQATRVPILTGEKLEMLGEFRPFIDAQVVDIIHPDLAFAGGITGTKRIADYAQTARIPVALHNVGSPVLCCASVHFAASIHNFYKSETALGRPKGGIEKMSKGAPLVVKNSFLAVPEAPGLGFEPDDDYLRSQLEKDEPFWS